MRWRMPVAVVLVGLAAGVIGIVLTLVLHVVQHVLYGYSEGTFLLGAEHAAPARRVLALTVGGLVVGCGWWLQRRYVDGDALSVTRAIRERAARLPVGHALLDAALQVVAVGAGASLGREGAPRQGGAALAGWLGDRLGLDAGRSRVLVACGAGAGLAAMYGVPLAGTLFTLEILLVSRAWRHVLPALVTSVIAAVVAWAVLGTGAVYAVDAGSFAWPVLVWAAPFGVLVAGAGAGFTAVMRHARVHAPSGGAGVVAMTVGFGVVGLLGAAYPELLGNGRGLAQLAFGGGAGLGTLALVTLLKPVATAICLRVGAIGGLLTPALATGASLGALTGTLWGHVWPGAATVDYVLVGAAALLAVTQRAALTSIVIVVELTRTGLADLPAMVLAVAVAVGTTRIVARAPVRDTRRVTRTVVGAAILRAGRVLAARRTSPPELAGRWELPGGKVEAGESDDDALVREIAEELGVTVRVDEWLAPRVPIAGEWELAVAAVRIVDGEPGPTEHDELRWLGPDDLDTVPWADPDLPFLPHVESLLREPRRRAVFFEEDDAHAVVAALAAAGWSGDAVRERYHGEDDDEDHPWAVVTDAPELVLELLVDEHDGWLDAPDAPTAPPAPLDLPSAPKRIKRPD